MSKALAADIAAHALVLANSAQSWCALLYSLVDRARRVLRLTQIGALATTDSTHSASSKEDAGGHTDEVCPAISEGLLVSVAKNDAAIALDTVGSLVVADVLPLADGDIGRDRRTPGVTRRAVPFPVSGAAACARARAPRAPTQDASSGWPLLAGGKARGCVHALLHTRARRSRGHAWNGRR
jgi:hypothetical protein